MESLGAVFLAGLLSGGVGCAAVQGGLLAALVASQRGQGAGVKVRTVGVFLLSKLGAYTFLGAGLGLAGGWLVLSPRVFGLAQVAAAVYMLAVVGAALDVHPFLRRFLIQPPRFVGRLARDQSKSGAGLAPLVLGAVTVLLPCGTTQAIMAQAVVSGSAAVGAVLMAVFTVATMPLLVILGLGLVAASSSLRLKFQKLAAGVIAAVALVSLNSGLIVLGSPLYPTKVLTDLYCFVSFCPGRVAGAAAQTINIRINGSGYSVDNNTVKAGSRVRIRLSNLDASGCQQAFTIPALGISRVVPKGSEEEMEITVPRGVRTLAYSCSMGMYTGELNVVN